MKSYRVLFALAALLVLFACSTRTHDARSELAQQRAPLALGADHELSPRSYDLPGGASANFASTWTGSGWITVWQARSRIDAARLGTGGTVLDSPAKTLIEGDPNIGNLAVDFDGTSLLVAWSADELIRARRFAPDLSPLGATFVVSSTALRMESAGSTQLTVTHGGGRFLVAWGQRGAVGALTGDLFGALLHANGAADGAQFPIATAQSSNYRARVASDGTDFVVAYGTADGCVTRKIVGATKLLGAPLVVRATTFASRVRIAHAGAPGNYVVLCSDSGTPDIAQRVENDNTLGGAPVSIGFGSKELASNGTGFSIVDAPVYGADIQLQRLALDGSLVDAAPTFLGFPTSWGSDLSLAPSGPTTFAAYVEAPDALGASALRGVRIDPATRSTTDVPGTPLSLMTSSQTDVRIASDGNGGALTVWAEQGRIRGALLGADASPILHVDLGVSVRPPFGLPRAAVAFAANVYGVVTFDGSWRFRRVATNGMVIDTQPKTLPGQVEAFAAEGTTFGLIVSNFANGRRASLVRFGADGVTIGTATDLGTGYERAWLAAGGGRFAAAFASEARDELGEKLTVVRVKSDGTREDATPIAVANHNTSTSVAYGGNTFYIGYHQAPNANGDVFVRRLPSTGPILDATPIPVAVGTDPEGLPALASDGASALVAWSEEIAVSDALGEGSLVYADGTRAYGDSFAIAPRTIAAHAPLAAAAIGANRYIVAWIEYDRGRRDDSTSTRVFARTLSFGKQLGVSCTVAEGCERGFCIEGICCDRACDGQCEACDVATKEGTCSVVTGAPRASKKSCPGLGDTCGYVCDGIEGRSCTAAIAGKSCGAAACASGVESHASTCDGLGRCNDVPKKCGAYGCDATACRTTCSADTQCSAGFFCKDTACVPVESLGKACVASAECSVGATCVDGVCCGEASCGAGRSCATPAKKGTCAKVDGQSCAADAECGSSHCVDGVCCDTACGEQCAACDVTGSIGKCAAVIGLPHGARTACTTDAANACASKRCDGADASACKGFVGKEITCRAASCTAVTLTEATSCDGLGACPASTTVPCGAFTCDEASAACRTSCAIDAQCAPGYACESGACVGRGAKCSDDGLKLVSADGTISVCAPARCSAGKCLDACSTSDECAPGFACSESKCVSAAGAGGDDGGGCTVSSGPTKGSARLALVALGVFLARSVRRTRRRVLAGQRSMILLVGTTLAMACGREPSSAPEVPAPAIAHGAWRVPALSAAVAVPRPQRRFVERDGILGNGVVRVSAARVTVGTLAFAVDHLGRGALGVPSAGAPRIEGDRVVLSRGDVREEIVSRDDGAEQSFVFARKPLGFGDLVLRTRVSGATSVDVVPGGAVVHGADGAVRYDGAVFVDGAGARTELTPRWDGEALVLAVPASVVEAARYPAVLDPTLGAITVVPPSLTVSPWTEGYERLALFGTTPVLAFNAYGARLARLAPDGTPTDKPARLAAPSWEPISKVLALAWNGSVGLVVTTDALGLRMARVGADCARLPGDDLVVPLVASHVSAVASGSTFFVAVTQSTQLRVVRVSSAGAAVLPVMQFGVDATGGAPSLAVNPEGIDLVWPSSAGIVSAKMNEAGTLTKEAMLVEEVGGRAHLSLARNGNQAMVVFREFGKPRALPLTDALDAAGPAVDLATEAVDQQPAVITDGSGFYAAWSGGPSAAAKLRGSKISAGGVVATPGGTAITDLASHADISLVRTETHALAVAQGRSMRIDPATSTLVGTPVQAAFVGSEAFSRAVVFDGKTYVVAFGGTQDTFFDGIYTARFDASGAPLDTVPFATGVTSKWPGLVGGGGVAFLQASSTLTRLVDGQKTGVHTVSTSTRDALGWNGTSFAATGSYAVMRFGVDGARIDATTIPVPGTPYLGYVTGVASGQGRMLLLLTTGALRYKDDGTFEDTKLIPAYGQIAAYASGKFLVLGRSDPDWRGTIVDVSGKVSPSFHVVRADLTGYAESAVASDGSRFVLAYFVTDAVTNTRTLRAVQVEIDGSVSPSFVIDTGVADRVSIASAGPGKFLVAYGKRDGATAVPNALVRAVTLAGNLGASCVADLDCEGGSCVDGYCCDSRCSGSCGACDVPGNLGHCTAITGTPHGTRAPCGEPSGTCGLRCDGIDATKCRPVDQATPCSKTECTTGVTGSIETHASSCDGLGACSDVPKACGSYACDTQVCRTTCATKSDCAAGSWCKGSACVPVEGLGRACVDSSECSDGGTCVDAVCCESSSCAAGSTCAGTGKPGFCAKKDGESCGQSADCGSGFCVDGVCCGTACSSQCQACDVAGSLGKCVAITGKPHGSRTACATDATNACADALCDGNDTTKCAALAGNDVTCRAAACAAGALTREARCNGAGTCPAPSTASCAGFGCSADGKTCRSSCASDGECTEGFVCESSACAPRGDRCSADGSSVKQIDGAEASCAPARCRAGKCIAVCLSSADCADGFNCDPSGACIAPSLAGEDEGGGCAISRGASSSSAFALIALVALASACRRRCGVRRS